jgi:hypothetical protein
MIKTIQRRPWGDRPHFADCWYEPFSDQPSVDLAVHWALAHPNTFLNTVGDINILPMVLNAASRYDKAPSDADMQELLKSQEAEPLWA